MPRRISYAFLNPSYAGIVAKALAEELSADYEPSSFAFILQGEEEGKALLESALALPRQPYYKGTLRKAAALLRSLVKNHPFIDGNKRFALAVTSLFLGDNGYQLCAPKGETVSFVLRVAQEDDMSLSRIERWLRRFCLLMGTEKSIGEGDRLKKIALRKMAAGYPGGVSALDRAMKEYGELLTALRRQLDQLSAQ